MTKDKSQLKQREVQVKPHIFPKQYTKNLDITFWVRFFNNRFDSCNSSIRIQVFYGPDTMLRKINCLVIRVSSASGDCYQCFKSIVDGLEDEQ